MRVRRLKIEGLTTHVSTEITLPETGLVVVTGDNGSGKSSLIEAVAVCRWGKSLRGTDLWAGPGCVEIDDYDGVTYLRKRTSSGRTTLKTVGGPDYQTAARAKREVGGDPKIWQRSCVFSSEDVLTFTKATDAERKRMLEAVLGLGRFDSALKQCRTEAKDARHQRDLLREAWKAVDRQTQQARSNLALLKGSEDDGAPDGDPVELALCLETFDASLPEHQRAKAKANLDLHALREEATAASLEITAVQGLITDQEVAKCSACGRDFGGEKPDPEHLKRLGGQLNHHRQRREKIVGKGKLAVIVATDAQSTLSDHEDKMRGLRTRIQAHKDFEPKRRKALARIATVQGQITELVAEFKIKLNEAASADEVVVTLEAAERVLGTRGLRSHVLGEALRGLEAAANYWLERFNPGVTVQISPCRELKSGGTSDEIMVEFTGVAAGHGYKGSSRGERRRQDVALTWAFGEVEAAASGLAQSTMWCDEPFDALDEEGVDALVTAMDEVRRHRCIVVISHSVALVKALRPDIHYHVEDGMVHRKR